MKRKFEGIWIPKDIWLAENLSLQEKIFLVEINSLDNEQGCYANNEYFAKFFGLGKTRVSEIINGLVQKGLVSSWIDEKLGNRRILKCLLQVSGTPSFDKPKRVLQDSEEGLTGSCKHNNTVNNTSNTNVSTDSEIDLPVTTSRKLSPKKLFSECQFASLAYTKEFFQGNSEYAQVDWEYYLPKISEWCERKKPKRDELGWRDTLMNWVWKDSQSGTLRTIHNRIGQGINKPASSNGLNIQKMLAEQQTKVYK